MQDQHICLFIYRFIYPYYRILNIVAQVFSWTKLTGRKRKRNYRLGPNSPKIFGEGRSTPPSVYTVYKPRLLLVSHTMAFD